MADKEIFTNEDCQKILDNCFKKQLVTYKSHIFKSLSGDVEGYLSEHYSLFITYEEHGKINTRNFFVKAVLNDESFLTKFAVAMDVFRKESFVYTKFFTDLEKLEYFKYIFPKCYLAKHNILVLEDLSIQGYKPGERLKIYNVEQCTMALSTLAHYHAYGIIYEERKSKENHSTFRLNIEFPTEFQDRFYGEYKTSPTTKFLESSLKSLLGLVEQIPNDKLPNKEYFQELLGRNLEEVSREDKLKDKYRSTCIHGDLWANNIMFKYNEDNTEIIDCKLIDFQLLNYAFAGFDIELFFYGNTTTAFRAEHKKDLLECYHQCFSRVLAENDVQVTGIMSYKDLEETCTLRGPEAKVQAICDKALLYLPEEVHQEAAKNPDHFKTVLIDERSKYILEIYKNNEEFREMITDELIDLLHLLEAKEEFLNNLK